MRALKPHIEESIAIEWKVFEPFEKKVFLFFFFLSHFIRWLRAFELAFLIYIISWMNGQFCIEKFRLFKIRATKPTGIQFPDGLSCFLLMNQLYNANFFLGLNPNCQNPMRLCNIAENLTRSPILTVPDDTNR